MMFWFWRIFNLTLFVPACGLIAPMTVNGDTDVESIATHVQLLEQMYSTLKTETDYMKVEMEAMKTKITVLTSDNARLEKELTTAKVSGSKPREISFEARLYRNSVNSGDGATLIFDHISQNIGGGYHNTSGIFTAPVAGTYIFWAHVMVGDDKIHRINLNHDDRDVASGFASGKFSVASLTTVIDVKKRDHVWFTKQSSSRVIFGYHYSSYGGFLLAEH